MARELRKILNSRIALSVSIEEKNFETQFANGYLLGELLSKFGLQPDFPFFQNANDEETKIRNFAMVIPALEDVGLSVSFEQMQMIMQEHPGTVVYFVYSVLKALKVLPMRNPRWSIQFAEKFHRKGSWADFTAMLNIDYETYRMLDDKYKIPGQDRCRNAENRLRMQISGTRPQDLTLAQVRAEVISKHTYRSEWETVVQSELDAFDGPVIEEPAPTKASALTIAEIVSHENPSITPEAITAEFERVGRLPNRDENSNPLESGDPVDEPLTEEPPLAGVLTDPLSCDTDVFPKRSSAFTPGRYLNSLRQKADGYRKEKLAAAKQKQQVWVDLLLERKRVRQQEADMNLLQKINKRSESDRKNALARLIQRRERFDQNVASVKHHYQDEIVRQFEYVHTMVNEGFWDMLGGDALDKEKLKEWCMKAEIAYHPEIYQKLCRNYTYCKKLLSGHFDNNFLAAYEEVAVEEGTEFISLRTPNVTPPTPELIVNEPLEIIQDINEDVQDVNELNEAEELQTTSEIFRPSHQPTLFWANAEFEEYREITGRLPYSELGWMSAFVDPSATGRRNLGHIVACVMNSKKWKSPVPAEFKYPQKFLSIMVAGHRSSQLKNAIVNKLAATYNLEVISVADLVQDAVEMAIQAQPEAADPKEKGGSKRRTSKVTSIRKATVPKISRKKSKSLAQSVSSLLASVGHYTPQDEFGQRLLRSLMEDPTIAANLIVDIVDQAIDAKVLHPRAITPDLPHEFVNVPVSNVNPKKGGGAHETKHHDHPPESKTKLMEVEIHAVAPEKPKEPEPYGWILTDLPLSLDVTKAMEQRLGGYSMEHQKIMSLRWEMSELVPDEFGPKPLPVTRSFFGAIFNVDCPYEAQLLSSPNLMESKETISTGPGEAENQPVAPQLRSPKRKPGKAFESRSPVAAIDDENRDYISLYPFGEVNQRFIKYLTHFEHFDDACWETVCRFYSKLSIRLVNRFHSWSSPQTNYDEIVKIVEETMKANRTAYTFGVSPEAQKQIDQVVYDVCDYIWKYRSASRHQVVQRMVGSRMGHSVFHYLFKQDMALVRDIYCKCQMQLREFAKADSRPINAKYIGFALYRKSDFPLRKRIGSRIAHAGNGQKLLKRAGKPRDSVSQNRNHKRRGCYTQPIPRGYPRKFQDLHQLEQAMLAYKEVGKHSTTGSLLTDQLFLHEWLKKQVAPFSDDVDTWHRKNELVVSFYDLNPTPHPPIVFDFPFLNMEACTIITENWSQVQQKHSSRVLETVPLLHLTEQELSLNTIQLKEIFGKFLRHPNTTVENIVAKFWAEYHRMHQAYPDVHPAQSWVKKLTKIYSTLCDYADYRHLGIRYGLRTLMEQSGYSEIIREFRNAYLRMIQCEIDLYLSILRFLWTTFLATLQLPDTPDVKLSVHPLPLYQVIHDLLRGARALLEEYDIESPVLFDQSMTSGTPEEEQRIFLQILSNDDEFWKQTLQSTRFYFDKCRDRFLTDLQSLIRDQQNEKLNSTASEKAPLDHLDNSKFDGMTSPKTDSDPEIFWKEHSGKQAFSTLIMEPSRVLPFRLADDTQGIVPEDTPWYKVFEEFDLQDLLATVRHDVSNRQDLKKGLVSGTGRNKDAEVLSAVPLSSNGGKTSSSCISKLSRTLYNIMLQTVDQEINFAMLKICRISVEGIRKCNSVRAIASETFCILDSWARDVHNKEQTNVDMFFDEAMDAIGADFGIVLERECCNPVVT